MDSILNEKVKKKNIYFLINSMEGGGAERVVSTLCNNFCNNHNISLITLKKSNFYKLDDKVKVISLSKTDNNIIMLLLFPYYIFKFRNLIKKNKYDNGISFLELANFVHILARPYKAIVSLRNYIGSYTGLRGVLYKFLIKRLYPKSKLIIVNSSENRILLKEFINTDLNKIKVLNNPIDGDFIEKNLKEEIDDDLKSKCYGKKVFVNIGRLVTWKGQATIINSFKKIYDLVDKNFLLLLIGIGPEHDNIKSLIHRLGLSKNIILLGAQKNVFKFIKASQYCIHASKYEGFPNVLLEAMYIGLPIITSNFKTGSQEIVFGDYNSSRKNDGYKIGPNGVIVDLNDFENNFIEIYKHLNSLTQSKVGLEKHEVAQILKDFESVLLIN